MIANYRENWKTYPIMNSLFLVMMAVCWGLYALIYILDIPLGTEHANVIVFTVSSLCVLFPITQHKDRFMLCVMHYIMIFVTLLPSFANGTKMLQGSGLF